MPFDLPLRIGFRDRLDALAAQMRDWDAVPALDDEETKRVRQALTTFPHTTRRDDLFLAGVDGNGDYPALVYGDSYVYFTVAQSAVYRSDPTCGLRELGDQLSAVFEFTWLPPDAEARDEALDAAFTLLASAEVDSVIGDSDYSRLKASVTRRTYSVRNLREGLIRPAAEDSGNLGIQLQAVGEFGAALRLLRSDTPLRYLLLETTLSLPLVSNTTNSLFHEHLKRLCCVEARDRGIALLTLSRSPGLAGMEAVERLAAEQQGLPAGQAAEHWFLRLPEQRLDGWSLSLVQGRHLPPPGAVTYLTRFHHTTPTLRLDMDYGYWRANIRGDSSEETRENEQRLFADLDYACHDQRCYGFPYPLRAAHSRVALRRAERTSLRRQIKLAAVSAGMKPSLFREAVVAAQE